jgi:2-C-methyl-D-erythritol 4-phosphate cytidylyltransferase/2-C-methyl-D-erythritol 4-phosphate cytidylyltransferase/2-C-methyl-D-erythritol 2,4-cyclodiphosphate synthase
VGERAGTVGPKQYETLAGSTVVGHTLAALAQVDRLHRVLVMLSATDSHFESLLPEFESARRQLKDFPDDLTMS